jgi:hypothetical protein
MRERLEASGEHRSARRGYLCHPFEEFPKATTAEQLKALLPWNAKAALDAAAAHTDTDLAA